MKLFTALALLAPLATLSAAPLNGPWTLATGTATLANTGTASPTWGNGATDNADASSIYAPFPDITLTNPGDKIVLTGSATMVGVTTGAEVFRFGIFNANGSGTTSGWLGYFLRNGSGATAASVMERANPNTGTFASVTGAASIGTAAVSATGPTSASYDFSITFERSAPAGMRITTSLKRTSDSAELAGLTGVLDASALTFVFNRVGFLATTDLNADQIQLTNVDVAFIPASVTPPPAASAFAITEFGLGPRLEPVGGGPTLRWNATAGRSYAVEGSSDLNGWQRIGAPVFAATTSATTRIGPVEAMPNFIRVRDRVSSPDPLPAPARRNVLFIAVDDLRPEIAAFGATYMHTPNIDSLVQSGRPFQRHYVQCATCGASRFALLTSRRPTNGTAGGNDAFVSLYPGIGTAQAPNSLPEAFRHAGYTTESLGKVSHYPGGTSDAGQLEMPGAWTRQSSPAGIWGSARNAFFAYAGGVTRTIGVSPRTEIGVKADGGTSLEDTDYTDGLIANDAIQRLQTYKNSGEPFFLAVGFFKPHLPFNAPKKYWDLYDRNAITVPPNVPPANVNLALTLSDNGEFLGNYGGTNTIDTAEAKLSIHGYRACVSYTDAQIGKLLTALTTLGLDQNTIVVLWGDHGWALGELSVWGKHTTLEESLRSPLVIRVPGMQQPGVASQSLVEAIDIYPTLADLCNVPIPVLEGRSFTPALLDPALPAKANALSYWNRNGTNGYSMRTERYRIVRWGSNPLAPVQVDLFDYQTDPTGSQSVTASQPQVVSDLLKLLP
jgi:arylsulfatase A-like enzyme